MSLLMVPPGHTRDNVPYRPKNWLRIAAEGAWMDILLNLPAALFHERALGPPFYIARLGSCGAGFLAFWEDLLTMVHSGAAPVR
ncbi:hypothetical protein [Mesorhizobium sp. M0809]|uniref:hypothetical protein n=2 Tax=unclassified Mesorhizobium TaxID=325217 RepID=UPI00333CF16A